MSSCVRAQAHSVICVKSVLASGVSLTHSELMEATGLAPRTLRYALKKLKAAGILQEKLNFRDMRKIIYSLKF